MRQDGRRHTTEHPIDADLAVLDRNIFELPPEALLETQVVRTMVAGDWVFAR